MTGEWQWLAGPFAFAITIAETWIASRERYWERQAKYDRKRESIYSANWGLLFEVVLLVDIVLTVAEPISIGPWVAAGAWLGQYLAVEKQRKRWRAKQFKKGQAAPRRRRRREAEKAAGDATGTPGAGSSTGTADGNGECTSAGDVVGQAGEDRDVLAG